jgi:nucleoside-diphosphate-sugar epimerase
MKVLVAGATGALGKQLIPKLVARGHEVVGTTRSESKREAILALGATPAVVDALDAEQVARVVAEAEPEVIAHELTALSGDLDLRHFERTFAETNRLRTEATDHLLAAGRAVGVKRFVAQPVKTEDDPVDRTPPESVRSTVEAILYTESAVTGADWTEGVVLRYGGFYGPGTSLSPEGGEMIEAVRKRRFPVVGNGAGVWSFIHIEDAADATVAAIEHGERGIYNIVDDEPARVADWLPAAASALGAPQPRRVPRWLGRMLAGEAATVMMTEVRGASNAKAKRELGWEPKHPTWREGFSQVAA